MPAPSSSQTSESRSVEGRELRNKLVWLTLFRAVAVSLLLAAIAVRRFSSPPEELTLREQFSYGLIGFVYFLNLLYGLVLRRGQVRRGVAYAQVLGDVALACFLVSLTGGIESPFSFTYLLAIAAGAIVLFQRGAFLAAAASSAALAGVSLALNSRLVPSWTLQELPWQRLAFLLGSNVLAHFLLAALAAYLARMLSTARGAAEAREAQLADVVGLQNQIVAAMPSGLITCDAQGTITFINPAARNILGLPPAAALTRVQELIPDIARVRPNTRRAELEVRTAQGPRVLGLNVTPLERGQGELLIVFQDLTELRRTEEELRRADHLASLGKLSAQLAHEIRNPLAAMRGSAQMLAGEVGGDPANGQLAGILIRESDRLAGLVDDFLRFARPPPPTLVPTALGELASDVLQVLRADPAARDVGVEQWGANVVAQVDGGQLRQVLINLLRNAFAAAGPGGRVRVGVEQLGATVVVSVWDSAGSIPPENLDRIFDPFFTTKAGGTGLGLSTAYSIVSAHGGLLRVSSSAAGGTEFRVELPTSGAS